MNSSQLPAIAEFFRDREIFITGGTGFLGKAIIEKILYSCPDVRKIYLLLRCKKGVQVYDRIEKFKTNQIFNRIREKDVKLLDKLIPLSGDSMCLRLGLSDEDLDKLKNVSVIVNSAASVRFDDPLRQAIFMNTRSARELAVIAEKLKNLKVLVHISTTYCNPSYQVIEEKIYPPLADWRDAIKLAENVDTDTLEILAAKYMNFQPNTYTFTKHLAEQIMNEYSANLPIIIFRPSIISPSVKEPFVGWVDNFNGVTGILAAGGSGLARVLYCRKKLSSNYQPLDVCVRSLLVATWKRGVALNTNMITYNCACNKEREMKSEDLLHHCYAIASDLPLDEMVWFPNATITSCIVYYQIILILFQVIPGIFFDLIFRILRKKPIALSIMRKFHFASSSLAYFMFRDWYFINDNCFNLMNDIKREDMEAFAFDFYESLGMSEYMYQSSLGGRRFLMRQKDEDLPRARRNYRIFWFLDRALKTIFSIWVFWFLTVQCDLFNFSANRFILEKA